MPDLSRALRPSSQVCMKTFAVSLARHPGASNTAPLSHPEFGGMKPLSKEFHKWVKAQTYPFLSINVVNTSTGVLVLLFPFLFFAHVLVLFLFLSPVLSLFRSHFPFLFIVSLPAPLAVPLCPSSPSWTILTDRDPARTGHVTTDKPVTSESVSSSPLASAAPLTSSPVTKPVAVPVAVSQPAVKVKKRMTPNVSHAVTSGIPPGYTSNTTPPPLGHINLNVDRTIVKPREHIFSPRLLLSSCSSLQKVSHPRRHWCCAACWCRCRAVVVSQEPTRGKPVPGLFEAQQPLLPVAQQPQRSQ